MSKVPEELLDNKQSVHGKMLQKLDDYLISFLNDYDLIFLTPVLNISIALNFFHLNQELLIFNSIFSWIGFALLPIFLIYFYYKEKVKEENKPEIDSIFINDINETIDNLANTDSEKFGPKENKYIYKNLNSILKTAFVFNMGIWFVYLYASIYNPNLIENFTNGGMLSNSALLFVMIPTLLTLFYIWSKYKKQENTEIHPLLENGTYEAIESIKNINLNYNEENVSNKNETNSKKLFKRFMISFKESITGSCHGFLISFMLTLYLSSLNIKLPVNIISTIIILTFGIGFFIKQWIKSGFQQNIASEQKIESDNIPSESSEKNVDQVDASGLENIKKMDFLSLIKKWLNSEIYKKLVYFLLVLGMVETSSFVLRNWIYFNPIDNNGFSNYGIIGFISGLIIALTLAAILYKGKSYQDELTQKVAITILQKSRPSETEDYINGPRTYSNESVPSNSGLGCTRSSW